MTVFQALKNHIAAYDILKFLTEDLHFVEVHVNAIASQC